MKGGTCCRFENGGYPCSQYNTRNGTLDVRSTQKSFQRTEKNAGTVKIGRQSLAVFFQPHAFKHMDELGMICYNVSILSQFLMDVIPTIFVKSYGYINSNFINTLVKPGYPSKFTGFTIWANKRVLIYFDVSRNSTFNQPAIVVYSVNLAQGAFDPQVNLFPRARFINSETDCIQYSSDCNPEFSNFELSAPQPKEFSLSDEAFPAFPPPPPKLSITRPVPKPPRTVATPPRKPSFRPTSQISPVGSPNKKPASKSQKRKSRRMKQQTKRTTGTSSKKPKGGRRLRYQLTRRYSRR